MKKYIKQIKESSDNELMEMVYGSIEWRYPNRTGWTTHHEERLKKELDVIKKCGYSKAFCIIADMINYIRNLCKKTKEGPSYTVGPGRGASVSSLVCYLLGITALDPIENGLIFERFINELRDDKISVDIDIGNEHLNWEGIIKHSKQKYGESLIVKSLSPCVRIEIGNVHFNILRLYTIRNINKCLQLIYKEYGKAIDIEKVPFSDEIFESIFCNGNTDSIFCFGFDSQYDLLLKFQPKNIEDIVLFITVYHPGLIEQTDDLLSVRNKETSPECITPSLKGILDGTYGIPVYQEQIIQILNLTAGFSLCESDVVRRAMSKNDYNALIPYKERFIQNAVQNGESPEISERLWKWIIEHACNSFNRSHMAAYARLSYYTAWLKYNYPDEFSVCFETKKSNSKTGSDDQPPFKKRNLPL